MSPFDGVRFGAAAAFVAFGVSARAEAIDDLRRQIDALTQTVAELERTQAVPAPSGGFPWLNFLGSFLIKDVALLGISVAVLGRSLSGGAGSPLFARRAIAR